MSTTEAERLKVKRAFAKYDAERSARIDVTNLARLLSDLDMRPTKALVDEVSRELEDDDNQIELYEFIEWYEGAKREDGEDDEAAGAKGEGEGSTAAGGVSDNQEGCASSSRVEEDVHTADKGDTADDESYHDFGREILVRAASDANLSSMGGSVDESARSESPSSPGSPKPKVTFFIGDEVAVKHKDAWTNGVVTKVGPRTVSVGRIGGKKMKEDKVYFRTSKDLRRLSSATSVGSPTSPNTPTREHLSGKEGSPMFPSKSVEASYMIGDEVAVRYKGAWTAGRVCHVSKHMVKVGNIVGYAPHIMEVFHISSMEVNKVHSIGDAPTH